jgi:hypothetical protein
VEREEGVEDRMLEFESAEYNAAEFDGFKSLRPKYEHKVREVVW